MEEVQWIDLRVGYWLSVFLLFNVEWVVKYLIYLLFILFVNIVAGRPKCVTFPLNIFLETSWSDKDFW